MRIRKGPYGSFATCEIKNTQQIYNYAMDILKTGAIDGLLTVYDDEGAKGLNLSYEFSGLMSINDKEAINTDIDKRRMAIGNLFRLILKMQDILLPSDNIVIEPDYIYFDSGNNTINLCYIPVRTDSLSGLSSIDPEGFENLLNCRFFREALSDDERSAIIYSIKTDDENMFEEVIGSVTKAHDKTVREFDKERLSFFLLTCFSFLALIFSAFFLEQFCTVILGIIFAGLLIKTYYDYKTAKKEETGNDLINDRTTILFGEDPDLIGDDNLFSFASLSSTEDKKAYGLYAHETKIGSDRFLSDIHIDDNKLSAIQAKIIREDNCFYIIDCSERNNTFLENRSLEKEKRYEIKNGQKISFGDKEFEFSVN
ncbi:MAG: FHA domain-containing protein [Clostridiales bacterium]|nr:FHA domain-containing protein [Clostridiales bacterium]